MRRIALIASILVLSAACDKQTATPREETPTVEYTDLSGSPTILFQVFGPKGAPRVAPIAVVRDSGLERLALDDAGWRELDATQFAAGRVLHLYRNGASIGTMEIVQGMYGVDGTLYSVPGCRIVVPQAIGRMTATTATEETVELIAASAPLAQVSDRRPFPAGPDAQGRTLASTAASAAGVGAEDLSGLDFHARWLRTGVGAMGRTLLASYIDPNAGDLGPGAGNTSMVLVMAEDSAGTFSTSYSHALSGEARSVEFQRLVNYADLNGDGKSELVLEAWRYAGIPTLSVLSYQGTQWTESFRVGLDWCVDSRR